MNLERGKGNHHSSESTAEAHDVCVRACWAERAKEGPELEEDQYAMHRRTPPCRKKGEKKAEGRSRERRRGRDIGTATAKIRVA